MVEPLEAEEKTAGGILLPDTAKQKPQRGKVLAVGPGKLLDTGERAALGVQGRRRGPLRQVLRHRHRSRRQGDQDPPRERHPGEGRQVTDNLSTRHESLSDPQSWTRHSRSLRSRDRDQRSSGESTHGEATALHRRRPQEAAAPAPTSWPRPSASRSGRPAATSSSTSRFGGPTVTKDGVTVSQGDRPARPVREHGRQARQRRRPEDLATSPATAPPPRPSWPCAIYQEGLRNITAGANPMAVKRGIDKAVEAAVERARRSMSKPVSKKEEMAQVGAHLAPTTTRRSASMMADAVREGRQGRRHHRRGRQDLRDDARVRRGHAVRQGLHLALLRHQPDRR